MYEVSIHQCSMYNVLYIHTSNPSLLEYAQALCGRPLLSFTVPPPVLAVLVGGELVQIRGPRDWLSTVVQLSV